MYVAIPIEIAGTVKLMTTPVDNSNLIGGICFFGIKSYIILLKSNNTETTMLVSLSFWHFVLNKA